MRAVLARLVLVLATRLLLLAEVAWLVVALLGLALALALEMVLVLVRLLPGMTYGVGSCAD